MSEAAPPVSSSVDTSGPTANPMLRFAPLIAAFAYLAFWQIAPRLRTDSVGAVLISTMVSLALIVWFSAQLARSVTGTRALIFSLLFSMALIMPLRILYVLHRPVPPWSTLVLVPGLPDLLFVWFAASIGALLSRMLRALNMIPPVAVVLALVDTWTVLLGGPVQKILESDNPAAQAVTKAMTVQLPTPKPVGATPLPPPMLVGFADFFFIAFFVAAICRFVPQPRAYPRMLGALIGVLCGYMLFVFFAGLNLPALLPLAVVMVALHWRSFHYDRSEVFALLYAGLLIAALLVGFWVYRLT